jgi:serine/threonine protein kinase
MKSAMLKGSKYLVPLKYCVVNKSSVTLFSPYFKEDFNHFIASRHEKKDAIEVFTQLCYALEELFKLGYVHRSVCPEKVRLSYKPLEVHLVGYGTAALSSTVL